MKALIDHTFCRILNGIEDNALPELSFDAPLLKIQEYSAFGNSQFRLNKEMAKLALHTAEMTQISGLENRLKMNPQ